MRHGELTTVASYILVDVEDYYPVHAPTTFREAAAALILGPQRLVLHNDLFQLMRRGNLKPFRLATDPSPAQIPRVVFEHIETFATIADVILEAKSDHSIVAVYSTRVRGS